MLQSKSPVPLWAVLIVGVVGILAVYVVGQPRQSDLKSTLLVSTPTSIFSYPSASATATVASAIPLLPSAVTSPVSTYITDTSTVSSKPLHPSAQGNSSALSDQHRGEIDLAVGVGAIPLITDSAGLRTGRESQTDKALQEIPQSTYYEDTLGNDALGNQSEVATDVGHFINITEPASGQFSITLSGVDTGDYQLAIRTFSADGGDQPELLKTGRLAKGQQVTFILQYNSAPRSVSSLAGTPTP